MPDALLSKLQFKGQSPVLILEAPQEFQPVIAAWKKLASIDTKPAKGKKYAFAIGFVKSEAEIRKTGVPMALAMEEDGVFWMAYPKKSSKKYKATITRDEGWGQLGELGFEGVRMVAIDDDWSAFRLRKVEHIGKMTRSKSIAMSEAGKQKTSGKTSRPK